MNDVSISPSASLLAVRGHFFFRVRIKVRERLCFGDVTFGLEHSNLTCCVKT